jgi:hypothetical protein
MLLLLLLMMNCDPMQAYTEEACSCIIVCLKHLIARVQMNRAGGGQVQIHSSLDKRLYYYYYFSLDPTSWPQPAATPKPLKRKRSTTASMVVVEDGSSAVHMVCFCQLFVYSQC